MWKCPKCQRESERAAGSLCGGISAVDDYIAAARRVQPLQSVRASAAAPEAVENLLANAHLLAGENLIHFAAFRHRIYPGARRWACLADKLAGYKTSKGSIRFPLDRPVDHDLIAEITRWRVQQAKTGVSTYAEPAARERHPMPDFVAAALDQQNLWERYRARPPYQQNDYIGWITRAKRPETRQKRLSQMLEELREGDVYMGMEYQAKG